MNLSGHQIHPKIAEEARSRIHPVVYALVAIILILIGRIQEIFTVLWDLHLAKIALMTAIIIYFTSFHAGRRSRASYPQVDTVLMLYGLGLISTLTSQWRSASLNFMLTDFLGAVVLLLLAAAVISSEGELRLVVWGIALSTALLSMTTVFANKIGDTRATLEGIALDPNDLASIVVIAVPIVYFLMKNEKGVIRLFLAGTLCSSVLTVIATHSRGGLIGFIIVSYAIMLRDKFKLLNILLATALAALIFGLLAPEPFLERLNKMMAPSQDYNFTMGGGRLQVWKRGLKIMADNPFLGVGPAVFTVAEGKSHAETGGKWSTAHNSFLQIGAEFGVFGLLLFISLIYKTVLQLRKISKDGENPERLRNIALGLEIALYGYISTGFFLSLGYTPILYLCIGISCSLSYINFSGGPLEKQ